MACIPDDWVTFPVCWAIAQANTLASLSSFDDLQRELDQKHHVVIIPNINGDPTAVSGIVRGLANKFMRDFASPANAGYDSKERKFQAYFSLFKPRAGTAICSPAYRELQENNHEKAYRNELREF